MGLQAARTVFVNVVAGGVIAAAIWAYAVRAFDLGTTLITAGVAALATLPMAWALVRGVTRRPVLPPAWVFVVLWTTGACVVVLLSHLLVFTALDRTIHLLPALRFVWTTILVSYGGLLAAAGLLGLASRRLLLRTP